MICAKYIIELKRLLHCETEDGKDPPGVHFETEMMHVDCNIGTNMLNVVTPNELVKAMNHGDGISG